MTTDDGIVKFAQRFRLTAAAVLIQVATDETAPAASRVAASQSILNYSDGRPRATQHVTALDVVGMTRQVRNSLWRALFDTEDSFPDFVIQRINQTVAREAQRLTHPERASNTYTRMSPPLPVPPAPSTRRLPAAPAQGPNLPPEGMAGSSLPVAPLKRALKGEPPNAPAMRKAGAPAAPPPDPADFGNSDYDSAGRPRRRFGFDTPPSNGGSTLLAGNNAPPSNGAPRISPDIVDRSARPIGSNGVAHDSAFGGYPWSRR